MAVVGKIGMVFAYYFFASIADQIFMAFFGNEFISFACVCICLCCASCAFRCAKIHGMNTPQETRDYYNASFKNKIDYVKKQKDIIIDIVLAVLVCLVFTLIPRIALGACYVFVYLYYLPFIMFAILPVYVILDFFIWIWAFHRVYRPKRV